MEKQLTLIEIAQQLQQLYATLSDSENKLSNLAYKIAGREADLTPPEGWPGSNDGARKAAASATINADKDWRDYTQQFQMVEITTRNIKAQIKGLEVLYDAVKVTMQERGVKRGRR